MQSIYFYDKIPDMEFLAGDTLDTFVIETDTDVLSEATMYLIISAGSNPVEAIVSKQCSQTAATTFEVQLTSADTEILSEGEYNLDFVLQFSSGNSYKKLHGKVYVHSSVRRQL